MLSFPLFILHPLISFIILHSFIPFIHPSSFHFLYSSFILSNFFIRPLSFHFLSSSFILSFPCFILYPFISFIYPLFSHFIYSSFILSFPYFVLYPFIPFIHPLTFNSIKTSPYTCVLSSFRPVSFFPFQLLYFILFALNPYL